MAANAPAIAFIGVPYLSTTLVVADQVTKVAGVELLGFDTSGDVEIVTRVRGETGSVAIAVEIARACARRMGTEPVVSELRAPSDEVLGVTRYPNVMHPLLESREQFLPTDTITFTLPTVMNTPPAAIGILETHGYTALLEAVDRMAKAANVSVVTKEKIGAGLVTIVVQGDVAAVEAAIAAGREAVGNLGKVVAAHVITRPHDEVLALLGYNPRKAA